MGFNSKFKGLSVLECNTVQTNKYIPKFRGLSWGQK